MLSNYRQSHVYAENVPYKTLIMSQSLDEKTPTHSQ